MDYSLSDLITTMRNLVVSMNTLSQQVSQAFPKVNGTSASATAGAATLPANPVGFITVTLTDGSSVKVAYYA